MTTSTKLKLISTRSTRGQKKEVSRKVPSRMVPQYVPVHQKKKRFGSRFTVAPGTVQKALFDAVLAGAKDLFLVIDDRREPASISLNLTSCQRDDPFLTQSCSNIINRCHRDDLFLPQSCLAVIIELSYH